MEIPPVVVTTKAATQGKKSVNAAPKAAPAASTPVGATAPADGDPGAGRENPRGPVGGFAATRSVSGTKTDTPLLETPRTINVVPREQIEAQQAQSVTQALRYTPGVTLDRFGASGIFENYVVRGFDAPKYLDGLLLPKEATLTFAQPFIDAYMLERIEVLKGPPSGLYGQSPPGGLVNMVSKRPTFTPQNEVQIQAGSFDRLQAAFDFSGPAGAPGTFAYRLTGLARDTDLQMDFTEAERYFINPAFTWKPSADTTFTLLGSYAHNNGYGPQQYLPLALTKKGAPFGRLPYSRFLGEPTNDGYEQDQYSIGYEFEHRFDEMFTVRQNLRYSYVESETLALRNDGMAPDFRTLFRSQNYVIGDSSDFAMDNQLQVSISTGPIDHKFLFGLDYQRGDGYGEYRFGGAPTQDAYAPVYGVPVPGPDALFTFVKARTDREQIGVYAQDQMALDRWRLTLGLRYDEAEINSNDVARPPAIRLKDNDTTGFAGLSYVFDFGLAPYASYATSFEPASGFTLTDLAGDPLKPTTGEGYEIGVKYQPPGARTLISAAWFDMAQQNIPKPDLSVPPVTVQSGEVEVRGYEFEIRSSLTDNIDIVGGYANFSAEISKDTNPLVVGNVFPSVAEETASLWMMYTFRDGALAGFGFGGGVRYVGRQFGDDLNTVEVPSYTLADAALAYDVGYLVPSLDGLNLQLNVSNLFDTYYVANCVGNDIYCALGAERSVLGTATYKW